MNEFTWGLVAFPLAIAGLAGLVYLVFGAWLLLEKWSESRLMKLDPIQPSRPVGTAAFPMRTATQTGGRGRLAVIMLLADKARYFKVGPNLAIAFIGVKGVGGNANIRTVQKAIETTIDTLAREEAA